MGANTGDGTPAIDFGAHLDASKGYTEMGGNRTAVDELIGEIHQDPDALLDWFASGHVDGAVLSEPMFIGHGDAERTAEANDTLWDIVEDYEEFYGLGAVPVAAGGEAAARELERCLDVGFHGGAVETRTDGIEIIDREIEPVLEVADRTGAPLLVHPKLDDSLGEGAFDPRWRLNAILGREAALIDSISRVIHEGVLDRYPDLNLVYHHLGGNIASMLGRMHFQLDPDHWPSSPEQNIKSYEEFTYQLQDRVHVDTSGFFGYTAPLRATLEEFPASNVLFGTDAPYEPRTPDHLREMRETVEELTAASDSEKVLGGNALELMVNTS